MYLDVRTKAILCIKVRDKMRTYCTDDIGQYFDLLSDNTILQFISDDNIQYINKTAKNILIQIFSNTIFYPKNKTEKKIKKDIDLYYSKAKLKNRILNLNIIYSI